MKLKLSLSIAISVLFSCLSVWAAEHYHFEDIAQKNGEPSTVSCIFAEDRGFVWVGTPVGLFRYDSSSFRKYTSWEGDEYSLPDDEILQVQQDSLRNIWVVTQRGIARYRPESDDFVVPEIENEPQAGTMIRSACAVSGGVLFGAQNIIYRYDYATGRIGRLCSFKLEDAPYYYVTGIARWTDGTVLCFNRWHGVVQIDLATLEISRPLPCKRENLGMLADSQGRVWLSPYNKGIECYDASGRMVASYNTSNSGLSDDVVLCMTEHDGRIWAGTDGGGINILDPETGNISVLRHIPGNEDSLPDNSIRLLHFDANGNAWAGRVKGGFCVIHTVRMKHFSDCPLGESGGLSEKNINCLYQEPGSKMVWVGTNGEGINRFDPAAGTFTHYPSTFGMKVTSISSYSDGDLLLSTFSRGLFIFDKQSGRATPLDLKDQEIDYQLRYSGKAVNLLREGRSTVMLLTDSVYRYHMDTRTVEKIKAPSRRSGTAMSVGRAGGNSYFQDLKGIYEVSPGASEAELIFEIGADTLINSVRISPDGMFWIASDHGVGSYDPGTKHYSHIRTNLFDAARSVVCDASGRLWIGTDHDLFAYVEGEDGRFVMFSESDGAVPNEYRPKSGLYASDGDIYLGGVNGLLRIDGNMPIEDSDEFEIVLTDAELDGERVNEMLVADTGLASVPRQLQVSWKSKTLRLRVMAREDDIFRKKIYRFRINGLYDEPIESYEPELVLRPLEPGKYSVDVSCNTRGGRWLPWNRVLTFKVNRPWYRTWWFKTLYVLLILIVAGGSFYAVFRRRQRRMEREYEEKQRKNNEEKIRFLINICHELRTPLTLIIAPIRQLLGGKITGKESDTYLNIIYKQAKRMKELIDSVLYVRKMEVNGDTIHLEPIDFNSWVRSVVDDFVTEAEFRNISLVFEPDERVAAVYLDEKKCLTVLNNLIANALKHAPENSEITVRTLGDASRGVVRVSVIDRGTGLGNVDMNHLFMRFYQGSGESSGTGIGLSASKVLIEQQGGTIGAEDNPEGGATFYFELPLEPATKEIVCPPKNYLSEFSAADPEDADQGDNAAAYDLSQANMLFVDDDEELINFLRKVLSGRVRHLYTARNGAEALNILTKEEIDAVVSDVNMPVMDGYTLCREIKRRIGISHVPIILLTKYDDSRDRLTGYKNGADEYLTKPFDTEMLMTVVGNMLLNRELVRKKYQLSSEPMPKPVEVTFSSADEAFLTKLNGIIEGNIEQSELGIPFLCQEVGMSRTVLYNKMKAITGMNIKDYITKIRMGKAIELVRSTRLSFSDISEKTGFSTSRYFSTAFKQYTGKTPSEYRSDCSRAKNS